jgi:hypothetical protein
MSLSRVLSLPAVAGEPFSELHGVDHATTIRAIADIWFPRACEFENTREQELIRLQRMQSNGFSFEHV